jgi:aldehyde dehydrogenase (NAD+)
VKEEFTRLVGEKIAELYNSDGKGLENSPYVPRIINERHHARIAGLIEDAKAKGATVAFGGNVNADTRYIEPTVLTDMSEDMEIMQEEVFGPVLSVLGWTDRNEVLDLIEKRPNPLALYVYSTDKDNIEFFLENTSTGSAVVNNNCIQSGTNPRLPFGGVGTSGMGRVGGYEGFRTMSNERSVVHQPLDRFRDILMQLPPYSERYTKLIMKGID